MIMIKRTLRKTTKTLILFCLIVNSTFSLDRFFIGLNVGRTTVDAQLTRDLVIGTKDASKMGNKDFIVGVHLGYNNSIENTPLFVGFEVGANYHQMGISKEENTFPPFVHYVTEVKTNSSILGTLKLGLKVKDLLFYAKGGAAWTNWCITLSDHTSNPWKYKRTAYQKIGALWGFGLDYILNEAWLIGLEYTNIFYPYLRQNNHIGCMKASPTIHNSVLRLTYTF